MVSLRWQSKPTNETLESKTDDDSQPKLSTLSYVELIARAKILHKMVAQSQRKANIYHTIKQNNKNKKM